MKWYGVLRGVFIVIIVISFISPVTAKLSDVVVQGTIFIGEEGLNLNGIPVQPNSQIGWWSPGTRLETEPSYLVSIGDPSNFFVNQQIFSARTGPWYTYPGRNLIFYVQDPSLNLRIYDVDTGKDRTEGRVVRGDEIQFRIDTNLYTLKERPNTGGAPITIYIRDEKGITYSSLINRTGASTSLEDIAVDSSSYLTIPLWDTGNDRYSYGTYEIWAECNANRMKDNYPLIGKTITTVDQRSITPIGITATISTITTTIVTPSLVTTTAIITPHKTQQTETVTIPATTITQASAPTISPTMVSTTLTPGFHALFALISLFIIGGSGWVRRKR